MQSAVISRAIFTFILTTFSLLSYAVEVKKIGYESGLSNDYIISITQDKNGFLWFATEWGLNRFDGHTIKVYKDHPKSDNMISGNGINKLLIDNKDNTLWIATRDFGLSKLDCDTEQFYNYPIDKKDPSGIGTKGITDLCFSKDGDLWVATYEAGIKKLNTKTNQFTHIGDQNPEVSNMHIWSIVESKDGYLYIGRVNEGFSILSLKDYSVKTYLHNPNDKDGLPSNDIYEIFIDSRQNIWLGTTNGLALFQPSTGKFITFKQNKNDPHSLSGNIVCSIAEINNRLWLGTANGGISIVDLEQDFYSDPNKVVFQHIHSGKLPTELSSNYVQEIFQDSFGNVWLGTFGGGVNFISYTPSFFNQIKYTGLKGDINGLSYQSASAICTDDKGRLWVGTNGGGIDLYQNKTKIANYNIENNTLPDNILLSALSDSKGNVWVGSNNNGLLIFNDKKNKFERYEPADGILRHRQIWSILEDSDANLWVASNDGVLIINLNTRKITELDGKDIALRNNLIRYIGQDANKNIWIASLIDGVSIIDQQHKLLQNIPIIRVSHIYKDSQNRMWLASPEGVHVFETSGSYEYTTLSQTNGLSDNWVKSIMEGEKNEIWLSTNSGLSRYLVDKNKFENYNYLDGTPHASFRGGIVDKDSNNTIYFGSQDGVCYFNSKIKLDELKLPQTIITGFNIYDTQKIQTNNSYSIPIQEKINLKYNQNTFTIDFTVMDYALKEQLEYAYSLKGFDDLWYETKGQNQVAFRNLPPGKYIFNVKSRIRNQKWSEDITSLQIEITPPLWLSWWAKTIYILLTIALFFIIVRYYIEKRDREKEQELNNDKLGFYTNVAHELKTPLTLILGPLADLMKDKTLEEEHVQKISLIYKSATRLLDLINQIMEFRKSETLNRKLCVQKGDIANFVQEIVLKYKELNRNNDLSITISIDVKEKQIYFDQEVITIILDNIISNAIKYTPQGSISIFLRNVNKKGKELTEIEIRDTGLGIPENMLDKIFERYYQVKDVHRASGSGIGLALVKNMIQLHEANIEVESKVGKGTSFYIQLKTDSTYPTAEHAMPKEELQKTDKPTLKLLPLLLIVEDNDDIRNYIADSLSDSFEIIESRDGKEGVELAIEKTPDIIISDIMMPIMDGINLCKILKEDIRTSHIPIILLTAKDSVYDKIEGYSTGADSYITKPFNATLLQSRIHNLLEARAKVAGFVSTNAYKTSLATNALSELDNQFFEKTTALIEENLNSEQISATFLAEQLCMSYSSFSRKIKAITGMTSNELIRKIKMQHAEKMLISQKYSISEIAHQLGFNNMSHFRQYFKDEFGVIPSKYLKNME